MAKASLTGHTRSLAALDIGSSKVCCLIAHVRGDGTAQVRGVGHQLSRGVKSGGIVDLEAVETSILNAVHQAEKLAGETIEGVIANVSAGTPQSEILRVDVSLAGRAADEGDIRRVLEQASRIDEPDDRELIHSIPIGYAIDGTPGIRDPRGMYGARLGVNVHVVTAATGAVRNLVNCVGRCHLDIDMLVTAPIASGLACLVEDEMDLGVTVVDMGGGTTTVAVFFDGHCVFVDQIPVGGLHVTNDIARGLSTPVAQAERLKTLYGSCTAAPRDAREMIDVPQVGESDSEARAGGGNPIPRALLISIIRPRIEETLELVRHQLDASGFSKVAGRRVVLTGGASQLQGLRELSQVMLDKQVRLGRPMRLPGLGEASSGPEMSTAAGMIGYALLQQADLPARPVSGTQKPGTLFDRVGQWLRENF